ncbi:MAG TPA: hypothetical protein VFY67_05395 [Pyrinomonadaceae bacterium]|nr:hypothetical protein [Pyrinomonadaceae bacterium]
MLAFAIWLVFQEDQPANAGFQNATAAISFITGAAVGIERTIEAMWTMLGGLLGSYWPLNVVNKQVLALTGELDNSLKPFHEDLIKKVEEAKKITTDPAIQKRLEDAPADIERLKARFDELQKLAPGNQRVQLLAAAASQNVSYLKQKYGDVLVDLEGAAKVADTAINGLQDFLATFKDNPGRRLISIYLGALLGLVIAGVFSLDVFKALDVTVPYEHVPIVLTGILIGLGSGPTHEVIRVIQEFKENRKGRNTKQPDLPS